MAIEPASLTALRYIDVVNKTAKTNAIIPSVSVPAISATVLTTTFKTFYIKNILSAATLNSIGYQVPSGQLSFVLEENEKMEIGPMDEIYVYMTNIDLTSISLYGSADKDLNFRVYTGLIDKVHSIFDPKMGKIFNIEFSTNMKKFNITNEYKPIVGFDASILPAVFVPQLTYPVPGSIIQIACQQSNVGYAYIYLASGAESSAFVYNSNQLSNGVVVDKYGVQTFHANHPLKSVLPFQSNFANYQYQKWASIIADVSDQSFCEAFFSKFGQFYFRQLGMFRAAQDYDVSIDPGILRSYDIFEADENIITRLELRWYNPSSSSNPQTYNVYMPPNADYLEGKYGPRYEVLQVPWAPFALAKSSNLENDPTLTNVNAWLSDYATFVLALRNASAIQGVIQVLGNNEFEVGQTVYLPSEKKLFYVTAIQHTWKMGDGWWTTLYVNYGRDYNVDFLKYIAVVPGVIGTTINDKTDGDTSTLSSSQTIRDIPPIVSSQLPSGPIDASITQLENGQRGNPFDQNPMVIVTNGFGAVPNASPMALNSDDKLHHTGVDLYPSASGTCSQNADTKVKAIAPGKITKIGSGWNDGWGNFVIQSIDGAPGVYAEYSHLAYVNPAITQGDPIDASTFLGQMGQSGHANGPHLHFQLQDNGNYPTNVWMHCIDPSKGLDVKVVADCPKSVGTLSTFSPAPGPTITGWIRLDAWFCAPTSAGNSQTCPLQNRWPYYQLDNYADQLTQWAKNVCDQMIGAAADNTETTTFLKALSHSEVSPRGDRFIARFNFTNVNAIDSDLSQATAYNTLEASATEFANLMLGHYKGFVDYMQHWPSYKPDVGIPITLGEFSPWYAAYLLKEEKYMTSDQAVNNITQIYKDIVEGRQ